MVQATSEDDVPKRDHLVSPLEAMAKAAYDQWIAPVKSMHEYWESLPEEHRYRMIESQRAALIALTERAWPNDVSRLGRETLLTYGKTLDDASRAMLVAISEGGAMRKKTAFELADEIRPVSAEERYRDYLAQAGEV